MPGNRLHFVILVEDLSGQKALEILVPRIIGDKHTCEFHGYKGLGHIPKNKTSVADVRKRLLLNNLPKLIEGFGRTFAGQKNYPSALIVVCDLDGRCFKKFRQELLSILDSCNAKPNDIRFCIAIEEGEAWLLGDFRAVKTAYPDARDDVLNKYTNDSICGTWECLANTVYKGGAEALASKGWQAIGKQKCEWAEKIANHMDESENKSRSFAYFRKKLLELGVS